MSIESRIYSWINSHRISPFDFETGGAVEKLPIANPESNHNPLGNSIRDLSLFVISDTHYHIPERVSYDRTKTLPTTRLVDKLRRCDNSWHKTVRPQLYNKAMFYWKDRLEALLDGNDIQPTNNALIVHAGDLADDSLSRIEIQEAILQNQQMMSSIEQGLVDRWSNNLNAYQIYLMGDHDVDYRGWNEMNRMDQIIWMYDQFGLFQRPASFFQEISTDKGSRGVLMLDTNLLNDDWNFEIAKNAHVAADRINERFKLNMHLEQIIEDDDILQSFTPQNTEIENSRLFKMLRLYRSVLNSLTIQQQLIEQAQESSNTLIIGHHPRESLRVAKTMKGTPTVISGHLHFPFDSDGRMGAVIHPKTYSGQRIRYLQTGAATAGLVGVEFTGSPTGYFIQITGNELSIDGVQQ